MQLKLGFSIERKCYIYNISITLSPLSIYIYTVACREGGRGGGGVRCGECGKMLPLLPLFRTASDLCKTFSEKFPNCRSFVQSRLTQQAVVIYFCLTYQSYDSVKGY